MTEIPTAESYILRIYRVDTEDPKRLAGLVETMDGSGERESFADLEGLARILSDRAGSRKQKTVKTVKRKK